MKKILLLSFLAILGFSQLGTAQTAPEVQKAMFTKVTASWCVNCGNWGWTFYKDIFADNADDAIFLKAHFSGDLVTSTSSDLKSNLFSGFQPQFYVNNQDVGANSSNTAAKRTQVKNDITQLIASNPLANTGLEITLTDGTYTINTATEFFQAANGKYHLGILVLEDAVTNNQVPIGVVDHNDVVRDAIGSTFGDVVAEGAIAEGTIVNNTFTIDLESSWDEENISFAAIIWEEDGGVYNYVNANEAKATVVSSVNQLAAQTTLEWRRDGSQSLASIQLAENISRATLEVRAINGQLLETLYSGDLLKGQHQFQLQGTLPSGTYALRLKANAGEKTILFQK